MLTKNLPTKSTLCVCHLVPSALSPIMWATAWWCGEHSSFWRAWLIFHHRFESAVASLEIVKTRSALTFHLHLLNRQTSLGCLRDAQSHLFHQSQISVKRSMLQACQDKQNTLDYKFSLQTNSKHVWTQDSQQPDWRGHEEKHRRGENIKKKQSRTRLFASQ